MNKILERRMEMNKILEKKRQTYLTMFKDGCADALQIGGMDEEKRSSAYYKQGYDFGMSFNFEEVYVGDEKENQTYFLQTREKADE